MLKNVANRVIIIITSKLSNVIFADEILVLNEGEISEKGK